MIYPKGAGTASGRAAALSRAVGSRFQWGSDEAWMNGSFITNAVQRGKPALIVESGGGARVWDEDLANMRPRSPVSAPRWRCCRGTAPAASDIRYGGNAVHLKSSAGGFWHPLVRPGDDVAEGEALGHVVDIWGDTVQTVKCGYAAGWIGSIRRPFMPIYAGDQVIELVERVAGSGLSVNNVVFRRRRALAS